MLNTINNIIDVSKLESGIEKLRYSEVNIQSILDELQVFFIPEIEKKGIKLQIKKKGNLLNPIINTDEYKLNSILINLIKNAIKFTSKGGVYISYNVDSASVDLWVEDTGIGIPENKQKTIFEQFVQADFSHSRSYEGSGLGLSIANGYVKLLGGVIDLKSTPDAGTSIHVQIPNCKS